MLTFLLTTKLGFSDGTATLLIATAGLVALPVALLGGRPPSSYATNPIPIR